jgi:kinesin family protein 5
VGGLTLFILPRRLQVGKTHATGQTLQEAKMINRSLSSLGNVIKALTDGAEHIPYRDSKLTRVLQDSLGGNAKTSLIITASSSSYNITETLSTLRFGTRAKRIKNRPKVNQERSIEEYKALLEAAATREVEHEKMIKRLQAEVNRLKLGRVEDTATDAADIRNEDLDEIDEKLTTSLESCGIRGELPVASANRLERIHQLIRAHTQGFLDLKVTTTAAR